MRPSRLGAALVAALTVASLASCGTEAEPTATTESSSAPTAQFPVTIKHAFGETTIEAQPERVATVSWANHEVPIALGVIPVGMSKATWGDDDNDGVLPWVEEKLTELGAETPVLFDETDGIDFEAVADTQPDVILASYSGLTPGGLRHAHQDRAGGGLSRAAVVDLDGGHGQAQQPGAWARPPRGTS